MRRAGKFGLAATATKIFATATVLFATVLFATTVRADEPTAQELEDRFVEKVVPLLQSACLDCHDTQTQEAKLDLSIFQSVADVTKSHQVWEIALNRLVDGEMPPPDSGYELSEEQRADIIDWIRSVRRFEANRNAGDPGPVLARRLSNAEYNYTIRDLTGVDIRPTKTFPVDPANEAGFDNSGESLSMSPALLNKYLQAARSVAEHLVLTPHGIRFAPHPVMTDTDRDKYCVKRIVEFYQRQPTDYADYFYAAKLFARAKGKKSKSNSNLTLDNVAAQSGISAKYLTLVWDTLHDDTITSGPLAEVQTRWRQMAGESDDELRSECEQLRDYVVRTRKWFEPRLKDLITQGVHKGSQPFVLWKNGQYAAHRRKASFAFLDASSGANGKVDKKKQREQKQVDPDLLLNIARDLYLQPDRERFRADYDRFCSVFPDVFYISERGRDYLGIPKERQEKGRLLSAGFHSQMGYYRDDGPLYDLVLSEQQQQELDALWEELNFFAGAPMRQYQGFLWFDRTDSRFMRDPEFDFARPEDKSSLTEAKIRRLSDVFHAKAKRNGGGPIALRAIRDYFTNINQQIRWVENARVEAEPHHLDAVVEFAAKALRRPLSDDEERELRQFYHRLRIEDELPHDEAIQDTLVSVLMSPHFCYRVDLLSDTASGRPLNDFELASRLSYFLWASTPDDELLSLAERGELTNRNVLIEQTRRMLQDKRVRGLATEFAANWLDFRRFEDHNSVDRERFPAFDDALRSAMFEEPIRFFIDVARNNRSTLDFLFADRTFVNASLAKHYGMTEIGLDSFGGEGTGWTQVTGASRYGRGGLLTMSVFLTKNAPGLRTSPVKRGYWVVKNLLGERIPPPPPDVPDLPSDESQLGELTLRETLAKHREHSSCSGCHDKIDPLGVVFEGYGPVGERRSVDLGGRPVQTQASFPDGSLRAGVAQLSEYIREARSDDFLDNFNRKLLSYALSRTLLLSDESLLQDMRRAGESNQHRLGTLIETIVTSPQFLNKRGRSHNELAVAGDIHGQP